MLEPVELGGQIDELAVAGRAGADEEPCHGCRVAPRRVRRGIRDRLDRRRARQPKHGGDAADGADAELVERVAASVRPDPDDRTDPTGRRP